MGCALSLGRLSEARSVREYIADQRLASDRSLVVFLKHFSKPTRLFAEKTPSEFVAELPQRWCARNPAKLRPPEPAVGAADPLVQPPTQMPRQAVFVSYCRRDLAAVRQLAASLQAAGVPFWFDLERLEGGDAFEAECRQNIRAYTLFLPMISRNTEDKNPRFFQREWNWALDRAHAAHAALHLQGALGRPDEINFNAAEDHVHVRNFRERTRDRRFRVLSYRRSL